MKEEISMNNFLSVGVAALTLVGAMLATAAPAAAQDNSQKTGGAPRAAVQNGAARPTTALQAPAGRAYTGAGYNNRGAYVGGYNGGYYNGRYYNGGYNNGAYVAGAALAGLVVGAAIGSGYGYGGGAYAPGYAPAAPYGGCVSQQWVWNAYAGRNVLTSVPYPC
jgi:hypothetical protein